MIGRTVHPGSNIRGYGDSRIRSCDAKPEYHWCVDRMSLRLSKLIDDAVNKGSLAKVNGTRRSVPRDGDAKCKLGGTEVGELPMLLELGFE